MLQNENNEQEVQAGEAEVQASEYEALRQGAKKANKKLIIILACVAAALILMLVLVGVLNRALTREEPGVPEGTYEFCSTYEGDIMEYAAYLELDRSIDYCDIPSGYGLTQSITEENRDEFDKKVLFLCDYLQTIIAGDANAYNTFFNDTFFEANTKKTSFSPQMLYNMKIS